MLAIALSLSSWAPFLLRHHVTSYPFNNIVASSLIFIILSFKYLSWAFRWSFGVLLWEIVSLGKFAHLVLMNCLLPQCIIKMFQRDECYESVLLKVGLHTVGWPVLSSMRSFLRATEWSSPGTVMMKCKHSCSCSLVATFHIDQL